MTLPQILQATYPLPPASLAKMLALAEHVELPKGTVLFRDDTLAHHLYVLQRGLARAYARRAEAHKKGTVAKVRPTSRASFYQC